MNSTHQDWTLSPVSFSNDYLISRVFVIDGNGSIMINSEGVTRNNFSVRPVINLNKDVTINDGDGTASNPYVIY